MAFQLSGGHVHVTVSKHAEARATAYSIDNLLGRLVNSGRHESKLLRCYLHGLTSFCLPDPLTQKPGTEEALSNSALSRHQVIRFPLGNIHCHTQQYSAHLPA